MSVAENITKMSLRYGMDHDWGDVMSITTIKVHNSLKLA